ncbi:MAG: response regulator transcription factor [Synergistaceae bacterium]|nr:response regulator transcription factor [Synergistaceae bacterium]
MVEKILIADDEENLVEFIGRALRKHGYKVISAYDGDNALFLMGEELPDLVILDLMMPLMDGWEVCRRAKSDPATRDIPVIMLTARSSTDDAVQGLDLGADDYMRKPFSLDELLARVRVLLRRKKDEEISRTIEEGELMIDREEREVFLRGVLLDISPMEFEILDLMVGRIGRTLSREEILKKIWGIGGEDTRTIDVHISRLRKKLDDGKSPQLTIQTLRGRGYRLSWEEEQFDV